MHLRMEFAHEGLGGDFSDFYSANAAFVPDAQCNFPCTGDNNYYCGAGNRISYYTWNGSSPLYSWDYPTGVDAGAYQFLIGGLVVPLMTMQGLTGKVTFLEKWGTGAPNTTGTYELDLTQINNFTMAWRPLHLQTDIFCSAGLLLPDKAMRQMTLGGWSGVSTFGIRLYTATGGPGVWGNTDWIEDPNILTMQNGRW